MKRDLDKERAERHAAREQQLGDRSFTLSGHTFTYRANVSYTVLESISSTDDLEGYKLIREMQEAMVGMLEPGQEEEFLEVLRDADNPFTFADLNELSTWLVEEQVRRPTVAPSSSTDGDANPRTSTSSTDDSSSPLVEASAA